MEDCDPMRRETRGQRLNPYPEVLIRQRGIPQGSGNIIIMWMQRRAVFNLTHASHEISRKKREEASRYETMREETRLD